MLSLGKVCWEHCRIFASFWTILVHLGGTNQTSWSKLKGTRKTWISWFVFETLLELTPFVLLFVSCVFSATSLYVCSKSMLVRVRVWKNDLIGKFHACMIVHARHTKVDSFIIFSDSVFHLYHARMKGQPWICLKSFSSNLGMLCLLGKNLLYKHQS